MRGGGRCCGAGCGVGRGGLGGCGSGFGAGLSLMVYFSIQKRRDKLILQKTSGLRLH